MTITENPRNYEYVTDTGYFVNLVDDDGLSRNVVIEFYNGSRISMSRDGVHKLACCEHDTPTCERPSELCSLEKQP